MILRVNGIAVKAYIYFHSFKATQFNEYFVIDLLLA